LTTSTYDRVVTFKASMFVYRNLCHGLQIERLQMY